MFTGAAYNERFCASSAGILDRERGRGLVTLAPSSEIGPDVLALMHNYSHHTRIIIKISPVFRTIASGSGIYLLPDSARSCFHHLAFLPQH